MGRVEELVMVFYILYIEETQKGSPGDFLF